jgi:hypothetical protein
VGKECGAAAAHQCEKGRSNGEIVGDLHSFYWVAWDDAGSLLGLRGLDQKKIKA